MQPKSLLALVTLAASCYAQLSATDMATSIVGVTKNMTDLRAFIKGQPEGVQSFDSKVSRTHKSLLPFGKTQF
jgi:hypothetical protein